MEVVIMYDQEKKKSRGSAVELNMTSVLANYATEAGQEINESVMTCTLSFIS
uniref:Uncharacterized protein n=1 Tax=Timema bartmani TaxID=61472 RepID=A0A7R9F1X8_9NEOP|nr:unnamed protein product [Timema bartmani]